MGQGKVGLFNIMRQFFNKIFDLIVFFIKFLWIIWGKEKWMYIQLGDFINNGRVKFKNVNFMLIRK